MTDKLITIFTAKWCGQCGSLKQQLESRGIKYGLVDVDTDEGSELAAAWRVRSLPSAIIGTELFVGVSSILGNLN